MTVRTRWGGSAAKVDSWSLVKQTTSVRPSAGAWRNPSGASTSSWASGAYEGNRFSKTTTSYSASGTSEGTLPRPVGHSGHSSFGGRKVRFIRCPATATQSPTSAS